MENLSHYLPGDPISALVPTGQHGGNQITDLSHAHTAPGSPSGDLGSDVGTPVVAPAPVVVAQDYTDSIVEIDAGGAQVTEGHEDHSDPYQSGPGGWHAKPRIKSGEWNQL